MTIERATVTAANDEIAPNEPLSFWYGFKSWICLKQPS